MWKLISRSIFLHNRVIITMMAYLLIFAVIIFFSNSLINSLRASSTEKQMFEVSEGIQQELNYLSEQRESIIASNILNDAIKKKDLARLLNLIQTEAEKRKLDSITVTDKDGFVLARSNLPTQYGDNIFQTLTQGKRMAKGETITAIVSTTKSPLSMISGSLVSEEHEPIGSLTIGQVLNDSFAKRFQTEYLKQGAEVVLYASLEGVVGASPDEKQITRLINVHFSLGSDLVAQNFTGLSKEIKIGSSYYALRHVIFPGIAESPGGAFILFPISHGFYSFVLAVGTVFLFFVLYILTIFLKKSNHRKRSVLLLLLMGLAAFTAMYFITMLKLDRTSVELKESQYLIYNSLIKFVPETDIIQQSSEKTVAIQVFTGGEAINMVSAVFRYDPKALKVLEILTENSFCDPSFFLEKEIDKEKGTVTITCGVPNPGFSGPVGTVAELLIQPLAIGGASLEFTDETRVLANDGMGTSVLRMATNAFYQVVAQNFAAVDIQTPFPIFSPSHPNSNRWYKSKRIELLWPSLEGAEYNYVLSNDPNLSKKDKFYSTSNNSSNFSADEDGVYYFYLQVVSAKGKKGPVSRFKISIDATPPLPPKIHMSSQEAKKGEIIRFDFAFGDELSGLQSGFYVKTIENIFLPVKPPFFLTFMESGKFPFVVRVFDRANNFSDSSVTIKVKD